MTLLAKFFGVEIHDGLDLKQYNRPLHETPHEFETANGRAYDWGHWLRVAGRRWTLIQRVLAWNPCNNIGQLYGCPVPPEPRIPRLATSLIDRIRGIYEIADIGHHNVMRDVMPEVYADDKSDEEIIQDGFWNMFEREEALWAKQREEKRKRRGRL